MHRQEGIEVKKKAASNTLVNIISTAVRASAEHMLMGTRGPSQLDLKDAT